VRFGKVHTVNNYFVGSKTDVAYPYEYSIGTGLNSKIISQNNVFDITGAAAGSCPTVVKNPATANPEGNFVDSGSLVDGATLAGCTAPTAVGWTVPYSYPTLAASQVRNSVLANAGPAGSDVPTAARAEQPISVGCFRRVANGRGHHA